MRTGLKPLGAAAVALAAAIALATPAVAAGSQGTCDGTGSTAVSAQQQGGGGTSGRAKGMRAGAGGQARGAGQTQQVASGTLTADQKAQLAAMAEEEKLSRDLYTALAAKYPSVRQFTQIARAEARHLDSVKAMLARYGIADPTDGLAAGQFASERFTAMYRDLLAGATSRAAALQAGVTVENADIADLTEAIADLDSAPDVERMYTNLLAGSQRHLTAFSR